jgi:hypothetical protein
MNTAQGSLNHLYIRHDNRILNFKIISFLTQQMNRFIS